MICEPTDNVSNKVKSFIEELAHAPSDFGLLDDLLEQGIITSMNLLKLIDFLEGEFAIEIPDVALVPSNFRSVSAIADFIEQTKSMKIAKPEIISPRL